MSTRYCYPGGVSQSKPTGTLTVGSLAFPFMITLNSSNVIPPPNEGEDRPSSPPLPTPVFFRSSVSSLPWRG